MRHATLLSTLSLFSLSLAACTDPAAGVPRAEVSDPAAASTPSVPSASAEVLTLAHDRSSITFTGAKLTATHDGTFEDFDGTIDLDPRDVGASRVRVTIRMASVTIEPERLAGHLRSPDFFDVERFPAASFESTSITAGGEGGATHTVTGNLTLHGVTRAIRFPATIHVADGEVHARATLAIDRREFGIVYPGMPDDLIRDEVAIRLDVRAPRGPRPPS